MSKEKLKSLAKYKMDIQNRLSSDTPEKHKTHPKEFKQYLERELADVNAKIEKITLVQTK